MNRREGEALISVIKELLQVLLDFIFYLVPQPSPSAVKLNNAKIVAHRGWHDNNNIKENTVESFDVALEHKLWGIEFDIRWTMDGVPVVHHDSSCERVWNSDIVIGKIPFKELRAQIPQIPTLAEVVDKFGTKLHLFIELKEEFYPDSVSQRKTLMKILSPLGEQLDYHMICLSMGPIQIFNDFEPSTYLLVADTNTFEMSRLALMHKLGGMTGFYLFCSKEVIGKHKNANQFVGTGFIRTLNSLKRELNRDVEWIFTNHPWNLMPFIESYDSKSE